MNKYLQTAIKAAIEGGKAIMEVYATDFDVELKGDDSPLTIADKKCNAIINTYLEKTPFPIISEENKQIDYSERKEWSSCWIVDPLDGTKEFIKRNGEFTVNIALVQEGTPVMGIIYVPVSKTLYYTLGMDEGSYRLELTDENIPVEEIMAQATPMKPAASSLRVRVVGSRSHLNDATKAYIEDLGKEVEIVSKGSSLKFCLVAEGNAHVYPRFAPTMEWDTAAGDAICRAVGVKVIDQETQQPLRYNKENLLNPYFLVTS
ncbi:3'(2'),5'-bisphosphate nucleotidase CysQ [Aureisphaera galaxeae]|uniref:3'(2'),5'-bisphosphate nucleotidase CysQ n=1 Tax=Aureisphaera galaxeae TaxID=1538023 RepID=UPI002350876E|nr:3'(2'),5'-bisphosphate nucleotidase CysQ [Aureisphaera galaxeae]MDC8004600.1 3'(2'),5'-bisphosphate nucleotidase CysQ [Aureisphaera galaxeae]